MSHYPRCSLHLQHLRLRPPLHRRRRRLLLLLGVSAAATRPPSTHSTTPRGGGRRTPPPLWRTTPPQRRTCGSSGGPQEVMLHARPRRVLALQQAAPAGARRGRGERAEGRRESSVPICICMYIHTYVCMCVCMYIHTYIHTYIRMCCVLIRPPIPYITSSRCKRLHKFRPVEILLHKRTHPRVPPCNDLNNLFIFNL